MARVRRVDNLTIAVQNVIPQLTETPINNIVMMLADGSAAIPTDEYIVSGKTVTWDEVAAGYDLEVGNVVVADYEYDDGEGVVPPYDGSDATMNPSLISYDMVVAETNIVPKLIHVPVASTFVVRVNGSLVTVGVDWTRNGKTLTWISATTLNVNDVVSVEYRKSL
jgi:hypothetical protein